MKLICIEAGSLSESRSRPSEPRPSGSGFIRGHRHYRFLTGAARNWGAPLRSRYRWRRGTAEIELLLVIPVLLTFLLLAGGALALGTGRLANVFHAENSAYTQVETGRGLATGTIVPMEGIAAYRPEPALPNRFAYADELRTVRLNMGQRTTQIAHTFNDQAVFLDSSWHLDDQPGVGDAAMVRAWFDAYVAESHPADLVYSLGLREPGPP